MAAVSPDACSALGYLAPAFTPCPSVYFAEHRIAHIKSSGLQLHLLLGLGVDLGAGEESLGDLLAGVSVVFGVVLGRLV